MLCKGVGHIRLDIPLIKTALCSLQVGYDEHGFAYRDLKGCKVRSSWYLTGQVYEVTSLVYIIGLLSFRSFNCIVLGRVLLV